MSTNIESVTEIMASDWWRNRNIERFHTPGWTQCRREGVLKDVSARIDKSRSVFVKCGAQVMLEYELN